MITNDLKSKLVWVSDLGSAFETNSKSLCNHRD